MEFKDCPDVRLAAPEDYPEIMRLMLSAHGEIGKYPISMQKLTNLVAAHYNKSGAIVAVIGDRGKGLRGVLLLLVSQPWYSEDFTLQEMLLFVDPDHRRSTYAKQLMVFAKKAAETLNLELSIGINTNVETDAKVRLYRRQFRPEGAFFSHNAPHG
jgi:GNAT superfamily N-acetyltransferase